MKKKLLTIGLLISLLNPQALVLASQGQNVSGDLGYEDGLYIMPMRVISSTKGLQKNPYGKSLAGKLTKEQKDKILKRDYVRKLKKLYNTTYRLAIEYYKYGLNNLDRWKEVKSLNDPVFGHINKKTWIKVYDTTIEMLKEVRLYFDYLGLEDDDYTEKSTIDMIDDEDLRFQNIKIGE